MRILKIIYDLQKQNIIAKIRNISIQVIKEELSKLSQAEQAELMHYMVELWAKDDFELSEAWKLEIDRRETALDAGISVGKPATEVLAKYKRN